MKHIIRNTLIILFALFLLVTSGIFVWVATLQLPSLNGFDTKPMTQSTKIYDRTGKILLYDIHDNIRRTVVPLNKISRHLRNATIAIEDENFYSHGGIQPKAILRAFLVDVLTGSFSQGGSTITQQVIKNTLLTKSKSISRKVKELILAIKVERMLTKNQILEIYLNEIPYGGNIYGAEEAAQYFFGVPASNLTLAESAYLAALPQAPTRYSPYGNNMNLLQDRKNLILSKMLELKFITKQEYTQAKDTKVIFKQHIGNTIKAPHFVFYIREYLEKKYGKNAVYKDGLKVITTLNYKLQKVAEADVLKYATINEKLYNASNAALVAVDPKTGQILAMVGSRNYFDKTIDGKFNVATARRQPGSSFKPIVYSTAFELGYTPSTVVFDVPTQFSVSCNKKDSNPKTNNCYTPSNYNDKVVGPITLRNALAQSKNIPSVKVLYLTGIQRVLNVAKRLGITTLTKSPSFYGLPLVLGGGEVTPLQMTNAYATFANNGIHHKLVSILRIENSKGKILEQYTPQPGTRVLTKQSTALLTSILTDIQARIPTYGPDSFDFGKTKVAVKTGTTNDFRDVWILGYTPNIAVGTWAGNNNDTPIAGHFAGTVLGPLWKSFMRSAIPLFPNTPFPTPAPEPDKESLKPVLRGFWQGSDTSKNQSIHSILHWVIRDNPRGPIPKNPYNDPEYALWEKPVREWIKVNMPQLYSKTGSTTPQTK